MGGLGENIPFFLFFVPGSNYGREREKERKEKRAKSFSLRSMELLRSDFVEPRTKVHHIDKGYEYIPKMRDFGKDPKEEILGNQRFRAREASYPCFYASRGRDSSYLGLFTTFELRKMVFFFVF